MTDQPFLTDVKTLRERARKHIENGALTEGYGANRDNASVAAQEFLEHAEQEQQHADWLAERIVQLGGKPNFSPEGLLTRAHAEFVEGDTLRDMVVEDLVAERIAIDSYREIARYLGDQDPTSRRIMEDILAQEEEHADDMAGLLEGLDG